MEAPILFVYGNCLFTPAGPWALFRLTTRSYASCSVERKRELFGRLLGAIEAAEADLQIIRVARRDAVGARVDALTQAYRGPHSDLHSRYLGEQRDAMDACGHALAATYVAVSLDPPARDVGAFLASALERPPAALLRSLRDAIAWRDRRVLTAPELERLRVAADGAHARLAAYLDARPARTLEVQWLVRRAFCRGLGEPQIDGLHEPQALVFERNGTAVLAPLEADVVRWFDGHIEHRGRALRIESELGVSWQALLVAGALPEHGPFPSARVELLFAPLEALPFAVDASLNARFLESELAMRLVRRRVQDADQIARAEADGEQGVSDLGYERTQQARDLLSYLQSASHPPLLRATVTLALAADDEAELERRVESCRRAYGEVRLHRPVGEQLALFLQHLPGQRTRLRGYDDILTPEQVAAMMPVATHAVGSRTGFHLGHTLSGSRQPVRFNLAEGSETERNTAILSVGALGAGKTTLDQKLLWEGFLLGARIVDCDPKGDHRLHLHDSVAPHAETIALRPDRSLRGMLDPLRVAPAHMRHDAAVAFLCDLLPARSEASWESAVVRAVDAVAGRAHDPTCLEVVRALSSGDEVERQVARTLEVYARSGLTQLGFADPDVQLQRVRAQFTYIRIRDLPGPQPGTRRSEYSLAERVGEQIVRLIAMLAMQLMAAERTRLKLFSFDEGWRLLQDPVGRTLLASLQRMGRSERAVPIISTQLVADMIGGEHDTLENLIGATFVFGLRSELEAARALRLLDLDPDDQALRRRLLAFDRGRCLLRDHRGRVEAVQVDVAPSLLSLLADSAVVAPSG